MKSSGENSKWSFLAEVIKVISCSKEMRINKQTKKTEKGTLRQNNKRNMGNRDQGV